MNEEIQRFVKRKLWPLVSTGITDMAMNTTVSKAMRPAVDRGGIPNSRSTPWGPQLLVIPEYRGRRLGSITISALHHPKEEEVLAREFYIPLVN